ncbi:MAG: DUF1361 domain-containing protein [Actinobacteria bacterium]|nr:DUF1361 domain-containing protein [Actinomycetota bacterium]
MPTLLDSLFTAAGDVRRLAPSYGLWMTWNLFLAFVPVVLAFALFRPGIARTKSWWFGVFVWVLFLPNAPYVLTDIIHLFDEIRGARSDLQILGEFVPLYLAFFAAGMSCFVVALDRCWRYVKVERPAWRWWKIELALQLLCAVGIYLGRVVRLNSWQVFTRPRQVLASADWLIGPFPIALILSTFVVIVVSTMLTRAVLYSFVRWAKNAGSRLRPAA